MPGQRRPRVVMTLLVRDEIDVVRANLRFHLSHGVDFVLATDHRSTDGTTEVLREFEAAGRLDDAFAAVPPAVDRVVAWRYNFVPRPEDGSPFFERMRWRATRSVTWDGKPMGRKVCHRASPDVEIPMGNHDAAGLPGGAPAGAGIEILHVPWRTRAQVAAKAVNGTRAAEAHPELGDEVVWHWREVAARQRRGEMDDVWREMCHDDEAVARGLADGTLVADDRLRDAIAGLREPQASSVRARWRAARASRRRA